MLKKVLVIFLLLTGVAFAEATEPLDKVVALVNDDVITESELSTQVELLKKQIQAKNTEMPDEKVLRKQVLQHLIDINLQLQLAKNNGMNIDSLELDDAINKIAANNHISLSDLRKNVTEHGMSWKEYRESIRKEMLISRVQQKAVAREIAISSEQVEDFIKTSHLTEKSQGTYRIQNIVIPLPEAPSTEQVKNAESKARDLLKKISQGADFSRMAIEESSGEFALEGGDLGERHLAELPELFAKRVVKMKVGEVAGPIRAGNGFQIIKLTAMGGDANQEHVVNQTHVRHILVKSDSETTTTDAEKQAFNIYQLIKSGKDFGLMAKQYSLDAASAVKGGDLGWVNPGELVPEFEKVMDSLSVNQVSKPVKTPFGWHLIQVLGRKQVNDTVAFQKQKVRQFLQQRKFVEAVQNWQQHLRTDAYIQVMEKELA